MSLREFIHQCRLSSEVVDIHTPVDADAFLSALLCAHKQENSSVPIMLFHKIEGSSFSLVANLFGTNKRIDSVLSHANVPLVKRMQEMPSRIESWKNFCAYIRQEFTCAQVTASERRFEFMELNSLYALPQLRCWAGDSRPYFSLPTVFTRAYATGDINAGVYRLSPISPRSLTLNWRPGSRAYARWRAYADRDERMPISVALGVDPALTFASLFPLPDIGNELAFWGFVRNRAQSMELNAAGLPAPLCAEIILEGYVDSVKLHPEGSFANHTGYYTDSALCPVMQVDSIRVREAAIMPVTVVGPPPTENAMLGATVWKLLFVFIQRELPCLLHLVCPAETSYLPVLLLQVQAPRSFKEWGVIKHTIQQHSLLSRAHTLILLDQTADISDPKLVYWYCMNLHNHSFHVLKSGMRVVDGVAWRYQGKRRVLRNQ